MRTNIVSTYPNPKNSNQIIVIYSDGYVMTYLIAEDAWVARSSSWKAAG